jgi:hypothetical protein
MRFSPILVSNLIILPLRYFFSHYAGSDLKYDSDPATSKIEIGSVNDFNKIEIQAKPRVMVNRGSYSITKTGLTDSMAEGETMNETKGLRDERNMVFINGSASVMIESMNEGTGELVTDMVSHFLVWCKPFICNTQGFKDFASPLTVSDPQVGREDKEIFQTTISVPYMMEEHWNVKTDALKLKGFFLETKFTP